MSLRNKRSLPTVNRYGNYILANNENDAVRCKLVEYLGWERRINSGGDHTRCGTDALLARVAAASVVVYENFSRTVPTIFWLGEKVDV